MAPLIIYADFESDVVDSKEGKFDDSCSDKYQDHVACSYGYKLVYADGRFSKFICLLMIWLKKQNIVKKIMKNHFKKELE